MSVPSRPLRTISHAGGALAVVTTLLLASVVGLAGPASAVPVTTTFTFTGAEQTFEVPAGVTSIDVVATGGQGSTGTSAGPGRGARVTGTVSVTPGEPLYVAVGGSAISSGPGFNGGGQGGGGGAGGHGGGASDIRTFSSASAPVASLQSRLLVAAGGGGAGAFDAPGGNAGSNGSSSAALGCAGGAAGSTTAGGASGGGPGATDGELGQGGTGGNTAFGRLGGGGGGGLFGGGGGGSDFQVGCGAGGGGGSNLVPPGGTGALAPAGAAPSITLTYEVNDTAPPAVTDVAVVPDPVTAGVDVTVSATVEDTGGAGVASASYSVDGGSPVSMDADDGSFDGDTEAVSDSLDTASLSPGEHEVCVTGVDVAGNTSDGTDCVTFTVLPPDTTAPTVTDVAVSPDPVFAGTDITLTATITDTGGSGVVEGGYQVDDEDGILAMTAVDGAYDEDTEEVTATIETTSLALGEHEVCVFGADRAFNVSDGADCVTFTVLPPDTTAPTVSDVAVSPDPVFAGTDVTLTATITDTGGSGVTSATYSLDGGDPVDLNADDGAFDEDTETVSAVLETTSLTPGEHEVCVTGLDGSDNSSDGADCVSLTVLPADTTAPTVDDVEAAPQEATLGDPVAISATIEDTGASGVASAAYSVDGGAPIALDADDGAFGDDTEVVSGVLDTSALTPGDHEVCVTGVDGADNVSDDACVTLTVASAPDPGPGGPGDGGSIGGGGGSTGGDAGAASERDDRVVVGRGAAPGETVRGLLPDTGAPASLARTGLVALAAIALGGLVLIAAALHRRSS